MVSRAIDSRVVGNWWLKHDGVFSWQAGVGDLDNRVCTWLEPDVPDKPLLRKGNNIDALDLLHGVVGSPEAEVGVVDVAFDGDISGEVPETLFLHEKVRFVLSFGLDIGWTFLRPDNGHVEDSLFDVQLVQELIPHLVDANSLLVSEQVQRLVEWLVGHREARKQTKTL